MNKRMYRELADRIMEEEMMERKLRLSAGKAEINEDMDEEPELADLVLNEMRMHLKEAEEALQKLDMLIRMLEFDRFLEREMYGEEPDDSVDDSDGIAYIFD